MAHYVFNQGTLPVKARMKLNSKHNAPAPPSARKQCSGVVGTKHMIANTWDRPCSIRVNGLK